MIIIDFSIADGFIYISLPNGLEIAYLAVCRNERGNREHKTKKRQDESDDRHDEERKKVFACLFGRTVDVLYLLFERIQSLA